MGFDKKEQAHESAKGVRNYLEAYAALASPWPSLLDLLLPPRART